MITRCQLKFSKSSFSVAWLQHWVWVCTAAMRCLQIYSTERRTWASATSSCGWRCDRLTHFGTVCPYSGYRPQQYVAGQRHWLTAALDQPKVVGISTTSGPGLQIDSHRWVDPHLLPPVEAKFSVYSSVGASSQWHEVCRWRHQWIDVMLVNVWSTTRGPIYEESSARLLQCRT